MGIIPKVFSQVDSTYIEIFTHPLSLKTYFIDKYTTLSHQIGEEDEILYRPNAPFGLGLGISYKGISISGAYGFDFMRDKNRGKTKSIDFQYHYYSRKFVFDFFFQNYKRFYNEYSTEKYILYPDIKIKQYGGFGQFVFNGKKFSYKAAFAQDEKQLKSAGSILLGVGVYYNQLTSDSTFTLREGNKFDNFQFGVNGGYAYTWAINKRVFISTSLTVGVNFGAEGFDKLGKKEEWRVYPTFFPRFSAGYNHDDWSLGLSYVNNRVYILFSEQSKMAFDTGAIQFTFIKRINTAPAVLKKIKVLN